MMNFFVLQKLCGFNLQKVDYWLDLGGEGWIECSEAGGGRIVKIPDTEYENHEKFMTVMSRVLGKDMRKIF